MRVIATSIRKRVYLKDLTVTNFIYGTQGSSDTDVEEGDGSVIIEVRNLGLIPLRTHTFAYWTYTKHYLLEGQL